jgi:hypothetical protein
MIRAPARFPLPFAAHLSSSAGARNHVAGIGVIGQMGCERLDALRPDQRRSFLLEFRELQNSDFSGIVHYVPLYRSAVQGRRRISVSTRASSVDPCQFRAIE